MCAVKFPLRYEEPSTRLFEDDGAIPNNPELPLLLYHLQEDDPKKNLAALFEDCFEANAWEGCWRNGIYPYHHYHSVSHEALGVYAGEARVQLGGEQGITVDLKRGDVLVIPAGVGHKNLGSSPDFGVVGAYPEGHDYDTLLGDPSERPQALENIRRVPMPAADPLFGEDGPLCRIWSIAEPTAQPGAERQE